MLITFTAKNCKETQKLGEKLAKEVLRQAQDKSHAFILGLKGDLGGGKTTFLQGFAKGLGVKEKILSPTFVIMKKFKIPKRPLDIKRPVGHFTGRKFFYHVDCYRIKNEKDILELNFKNIISDPKNIVAIEWPSRIKKLLPKSAIIIEFSFINEKGRKITWKKDL